MFICDLCIVCHSAKTDLYTVCHSTETDLCILCHSSETVCLYHSAGVMYGQSRLVQSCIDWLEKTLLPLQSAELLQNIRHVCVARCLSMAQNKQL